MTSTLDRRVEALEVATGVDGGGEGAGGASGS